MPIKNRTKAQWEKFKTSFSNPGGETVNNVVVIILVVLAVVFILFLVGVLGVSPIGGN